MKKILILCLTVLLSGSVFQVYAKEDASNDIKISNRLFSITLPQDTSGTYSVLKKSNGIFIYDKVSKKAEFGGFAFGVKAFKKPSGHAMMPGGRKIGELSKGKGKPYDVVLIYPTDIQFDYNNEATAGSYIKLFKYAEKTAINGKFGYKFFKDRGMKGEDLYQDILNKHLVALEENWDSKKLEKENMSTMYSTLASSGKNNLDKIGYAYYDVNDDGIDELLIGEIIDGNKKGIVYDIYTMVNRKPAHVISAESNRSYYVSEGCYICSEFVPEDDENYWLIYSLVENSTDLYPQIGFRQDVYDRNMPWYISYGLEDDWKNVSEGTFKSRKSDFDKYIRFEYTPLSSLKGDK